MLTKSSRYFCMFYICVQPPIDPTDYTVYNEPVSLLMLMTAVSC